MGRAELAAPRQKPSVLVLGWRLLCSTRLAIVLILLVAVGALAGVVLAQAPDRVLSDQELYRRWLGQVRPLYGVLTDPLSALGLFDVYRSLWFRALALALTANVIACTVNRLPGIWRAVFRPQVRPSQAFLQQAPQRADIFLPSSPAAAGEGVASLLRMQRYRVLLARDGEDVCLFADRNRLARLGTLLNHSGLVLILVGALVSSLFGFRDDQFIIAEGKTRSIGHGIELAARLDDFSDEYYPSGAPKDYYSDLALLKGGQEVARQRVRVNEPLNHEGVTFYQAAFGNAVTLEARGGDGQVLYDDVVPLAMSFMGYSAGAFELPTQRLTVVVLWTAGSAPGSPDLVLYGYRQEDRAIAFESPLWQGAPSEAYLGGLSFRFKDVRQYSVLQVARDPGANLIWLASGLMILGVIAAFYLPHRRLWARLSPEGEGTRLRLAGASERDPGFVREFDRIVNSEEWKVKSEER